MLRSALTVAALPALVAVAGCTPAAYAGGSDDHSIEHGSLTDAGVVPPQPDGSFMPQVDAWSPEPVDAWSAGPVDAWVPQVDAYHDPNQCPTYGSDVEPIYQRHCASCHTTGRDAHFGSSYSVATQSSSSCRTSMAACTLSLGRPGGSMASRDRLGGFSTTEQQTIQSWIGCGMPM